LLGSALFKAFLGNWNRERIKIAIKIVLVLVLVLALDIVLDIVLKNGD
jgi:hypothetical protein